MTGHFFLLIFIAEKLDLPPIDIEDGLGLKNKKFDDFIEVNSLFKIRAVAGKISST